MRTYNTVVFTFIMLSHTQFTKSGSQMNSLIFPQDLEQRTNYTCYTHANYIKQSLIQAN